MYEVPPVPPSSVRWPHTILLPPRRRMADRRNFAMRLGLIVLQGVTLWGSATSLLRWLLVGVWGGLLLGPLADLLPVTWQRPAAILRISQAILWVVLIVGYVLRRFWGW